MAKKKSRRMKLFSGDGKDTLATYYRYPTDPLPRMTDEEQRLDAAFDGEYGDIADLWRSIDVLRQVLVERRAQLDDQSTHRAAVDLLATKALTDARGAYVLIRRGYVLASLAPLRAAWEATDLMHYFRLHPEEVGGWIAEDERFSTLGWIRKELPFDPTPIYDFLAYGMHANWRFIPQLTAEVDDSGEDRIYTLIAGPSRFSQYCLMFALTAARQALVAIGEVHQNRPELLSDAWRLEYGDCVEVLDKIFVTVSAIAKEYLESSMRLVEQASREGQPSS